MNRILTCTTKYHFYVSIISKIAIWKSHIYTTVTNYILHTYKAQGTDLSKSESSSSWVSELATVGDISYCPKAPNSFLQQLGNENRGPNINHLAWNNICKTIKQTKHKKVQNSSKLWTFRPKSTLSIQCLEMTKKLAKH